MKENLTFVTTHNGERTERESPHINEFHSKVSRFTGSHGEGMRHPRQRGGQ